MTERNGGFTLIELIVVIVILGILAATALPRFVNLQGDARNAVMQGVAASMEGAKQLVQARWLATGSSAATQASVPGAPGDNVLVIINQTAATNGMPDTAATGMEDAISLPAGGAVTCTPGAATFVCTHSGIAACSVTYTRATGAVTIGATAANCG